MPRGSVFASYAEADSWISPWFALVRNSHRSAPSSPSHQNSGSSGFAVGANHGLSHQDSTNEFSLFFDHVSHKSLFIHRFVMG
jgi:hypothetical protein